MLRLESALLARAPWRAGSERALEAGAPRRAAREWDTERLCDTERAVTRQSGRAAMWGWGAPRKGGERRALGGGILRLAAQPGEKRAPAAGVIRYLCDGKRGVRSWKEKREGCSPRVPRQGRAVG